MANAPVLETERLILRGHTLDDFEDSAAMWAEAEVTRFIGGKPSTREEAWARFLRNIGHWPIVGFGYWVVTDKATGAFLGEAGFANFKRMMEPAFGDAPEIGWALSSAAHGRGVATEAVRAMLAWADANLSARRFVCMIAPENTASIRVAEKCGFREYAHATYKDAASILFERVR